MDKLKMRKSALQWWRELSDEAKHNLAMDCFPELPFIAVSKSSSKIEAMFSLLHDKEN